MKYLNAFFFFGSSDEVVKSFYERFTVAYTSDYKASEGMKGIEDMGLEDLERNKDNTWEQICSG